MEKKKNISFKGGDGKHRMMLFIAIFITAIFVAIGYWQSKNKAPGPVTSVVMAEAPKITSTPGVGKVPSREYIKLQQEKNAQEVLDAQKKGTSAVPTIIRASYLSDDENKTKTDTSKTNTPGCDLVSLNRAKEAGVGVLELRCKACSPASLHAANYTAGELREAGLTAAQLLEAEFTSLELRQAGFAVAELNNAGVNCKNLITAQFTAAELKERGCSLAELKAAGFTADQLKDAGFTAAELKAAGFSAKELAEAGFSAAELKKAGFTLSELKAAGFSSANLAKMDFDLTELKRLHASAEPMDKLKEMGPNVTALRAAGYTVAELKMAGYSAQELKAASASALELKKAGFSAKNLRQAGFELNQLKLAGFSAKELMDAGYTAAELKNLGFTAEALKQAGFSAADLRKAGFSADELARAGFSANELKGAGYSDGELSRVGLLAETNAKKGLSNPVSQTINSQQAGVSGQDFNANTKSFSNTGNNSGPLSNQGMSSSNNRVAGSANLLDRGNIPAAAQLISLDGSVSSSGAQIDPAAAALEHLQQIQAAQISDQERKQKLDQMRQGMATQANELLASWSPPTPQQMVAGIEEPPEQAGGKSGAANAAAAGQLPPGPVDVIKAGSIMFAVLDVGINSDEQSPVLATIVEGQLRGAKLLGQFTRQNKKILLSFTLMNTPKLPSSLPINSVAIDVNTARTMLADKVDSHYMLRYGTLFASSFISGLGDAVVRSGTTATASPGGIVVNQPVLDTAGLIAGGLGSVGKQYASSLGSNFTTPPTVYVQSGSGIGILFMADLSVPVNSRGDS